MQVCFLCKWLSSLFLHMKLFTAASFSSLYVHWSSEMAVSLGGFKQNVEGLEI